MLKADRPIAGLSCGPWFLGLILLFCALSTAGQARADPITLGEYHSRIEDSILLLESGQGDLVETDVMALRKRFPLGLQVREAGGRPVPLDCKGIQAWLAEARKSEKGRGLLVARLRWLSRQISAKGPDTPLVEQKWDSTRKALDGIYNSEEFAHLKRKKPSLWEEFLAPYLKALSDWFRERLRNMAGIEGRWADYVIYAIYGFIILAGCVVIFLILRSFGPVGWRFGRRKRTLPEPEKVEPMDWSRWRNDAQGHASRGAFRDAIRALFVSALMEGHQKGWWIYEPEATNREHLARVEGPDERRRALKRFMDLYERAWYGLGKPSETDFQQGEVYVRTIGSAA